MTGGRIEEGAFKAGSGEEGEFLWSKADAARQLVFGGERRLEHGGVIGAERDAHAAAHEDRERVIGFGGRRAQLEREGAGAQIARGADFERHPGLCERIHQALAAHGGDAVADAFGAQEIDRVDNGFGAAGLSCVNEAVEARCGGEIVGGAEFGCRQRQLIAAHSDGDDAFAAQSRGAARDFHRGGGAELAHAIENPCALKLRGFARGFADRAEICGGVLLAAQHHSGGQSDFGAEDILRGEGFGEALRD